jgi:hypothetical protein
MGSRAMNLAQFSALPLSHRALFVLLLVTCIWVGLFYSIHVYSLPFPWGMWLSAIGLAGLAVLALHALWQRNDWAAWLALAVVSGLLTIDLYSWSTNAGRIWPLATAAMSTTMIYFIFQIGEPATKVLTRRMKIFFAIIIAFPAWVAIGGLFFPGQIDQFLPFRVPPLHARFIGAMYAAGATMMLFAARASAWHEVRVVTVILGAWTGLLGLVSLLHLGVFDWTWRPTWFWWVAYIWFPLGAAFIAWNQRQETTHPDERPLSALLRGFLVAQGVIAVVTALALLFAPGAMIKLWPWTITPLLAQIYSAPFLAYGIGTLYSSGQRVWSEARIPVIATLVLALVAVVASFLHSGLFKAGNVSTWVWFGGLGLSALAGIAFTAIPRLRNGGA